MKSPIFEKFVNLLILGPHDISGELFEYLRGKKTAFTLELFIE